MKRILIALAFAAVAGTAAAQTVQTPSMGTMNAEMPGNTPIGGTGPNDAADSVTAPEIANAPIPMSAAAAIARKRIEMDGYRDVRGLAKGPDGLWQATAMRGNTSVQVTVDRAGNVAAK
jgi:hypothetical protein